MAAARSPEAHDFMCIGCERVERRASAIVVPHGWRRTDEGMVCDDCAKGAPPRPAVLPSSIDLVELSDRDIVAAMTEEVAAATQLVAPVAAHIAAGILLGFRLGAPMEARGMALIGAEDARLVARDALSLGLAIPNGGQAVQP